MKFIYCPECGKMLDLKEIGDEGLIPFCIKCQKPYFDWFGQCTISAVVNEHDEVALLKQDYVSKTNWVLVAGYVKQGETLEESATREVYEETGQLADNVKYISSYYYVEKELLMIGFKCSVKKRAFNNSPEVDGIRWVNIDDADKMLREGSIAWQLLNAMKTDKKIHK